MAGFSHLADFLQPVNRHALSNDEEYKDGQAGKDLAVFENDFPQLDATDIVMVGCGERRGAGIDKNPHEGPDTIRKTFYKLYNWHHDVQLADIGNIKTGATIADSYAALRVVLKELAEAGKTVLILGGSHDLTLAQYQSYAERKKIIEAVCVDALIDIDIDSRFKSKQFLMEMLTGEPNYIRHYNHIGFQSYYVHPRMLETMDKLRFDCFRVGHAKENIEDMEPVIRNCQLFSLDLAALAYAFAPGSGISPNGLNGEEACTLMRYAGLSPEMNTVGIYGYRPEHDSHLLSAKQVSHMLWYFIDGYSRGKREARLEDKDAFNEFHMAFAEVETTFLQSKKTGRWWMQLPDKKFIACSYKDYITASSNEVPERWLRAQERS